MEGPSRPSGHRTLTPAVLLAAAFTTACAGISVVFVAAHGGLEMPTAATASGATATASPTLEPAVTAAPATTGPAPSPVAPTPTIAEPSQTSSPAPPSPVASLDSLAVLPGCPGHPGCYLYTVRRGDTLGSIADRWAIGLSIVEALNPEIRDPSTIVPGQVVYLGRSPVVRLDRCPDAAGCYLYVVRSGDRLSTIAGRYGTTTSAILALNPEITDPNSIRTGQTIRIPGP